METFNVSFIDLTIVLLYLFFIVLWGLKNGKSSDSQSYFLAGRTMPWWVVGLSLFAASISSTTLIGQSGDSLSHLAVVQELLFYYFYVKALIQKNEKS